MRIIDTLKNLVGTPAENVLLNEPASSLRGSPPEAEKPSEIRWHKLERPRDWRPNAGEDLAGYYIGKTMRNGPYGQYEVVLIAVPVDDGMSRPLMVSGVQILQAIDGSGIQPGKFIRVVFGGYEDITGGRQRKRFDVYAAEGSITVEQAQAYLTHVSEAA